MSLTNPAFTENHQNQLQDEKELEMCKKELRSKIKEINNAIAKEGENLSRIQVVYDADKLQLDTLVTNTERQESWLASHSNQNEVKSTSENDKLREENMNLQSEVGERQELLMKVKLLQSTLFQMSPPWWQEAQNLKDLKAKDPHEQNSESEEATGLKKGLTSKPAESMMSSTQEDDIMSASSDLFGDNQVKSSTEHVSILKMPEIFFSDPSQAYESASDLVRCIPFLRQNIKDRNLQKDVEAKHRQMKEEDEEMMLQVAEMKARIEREQEKAERFRGHVKSHEHAKDPMEVLDEDVTSVFSQCRVRMPTSPSTLQKMQLIEKNVNELVTQAEKIPVEHLKRKRQKNLREKKKREQEERLRLEMEKHREKMVKYKKKAMDKRPKITRRMLMPRSNPDDNEVKGVLEAVGPAMPQQEDPVSSFEF